MKILDMYCGAGGASMGYSLAYPNAHITGMDIRPQPDYPFDFIQQDCTLITIQQLQYYNLIHASPPCQALTTASNRWRGYGGIADNHSNLIPLTIQQLANSTIDYIIENVPGAKQYMPNPTVLRGGIFGLQVDRPRLFISNRQLVKPRYHRLYDSIGVYGALDGRLLSNTSGQYAPRSLDEAQRAMGIDWMQWEQLKEAIPPAYTHYLGNGLQGDWTIDPSLLPIYEQQQCEQIQITD